LKVLIYVGKDDISCNWRGNEKWLHELFWTYKE